MSEPLAEVIAECKALLQEGIMRKEPHLREDALLLDARVNELLEVVVAGVVEQLRAGVGDQGNSR
jgi:hypothetical protein